jgi:hypothetical protein
MTFRASDRARCKVCQHPERAAQEIALARGVSMDTLHGRYPDVSRDSFGRHRKNHMSDIMARLRAEELEQAESAKYRKALDQLREREERSLLAHLVATRHKLQSLGEKADAKNDYRTSGQIQSRILGVLEATGRVLGSFADSHARVVNNNTLVLDPSYLKLRSGLMRCLANFPQARAAVAQMLAELESVENQPAVKAEPLLITATVIEDAIVVANDEDESYKDQR